MNTKINLHSHMNVEFITWFNEAKQLWYSLVLGTGKQVYGYSRSAVAECARQDISRDYSVAAIRD